MLLCIGDCNLVETELQAADSVKERDTGDNSEEPLRAYEKRAINFLINEYLLQNNYKLTSVTFSEENENQVSAMSISSYLLVTFSLCMKIKLCHLYTFTYVLVLVTIARRLALSMLRDYLGLFDVPRILMIGMTWV